MEKNSPCWTSEPIDFIQVAQWQIAKGMNSGELMQQKERQRLLQKFDYLDTKTASYF